VAHPGFTLIELMVSVGVISLLVSLMLPAVQKTREAARQTQCRSHLRQLAVAVFNFEDVKKRIPPSDLGDGWGTWATLLLPYLEQNGPYRYWDLEIPYYLQSSDCGVNVPVYICPSRNVARGKGDQKFLPRFGLRTGPTGWGDFAGVAGTEIDAADGAFVRAINGSTGKTVAIPLTSATPQFVDPRYPIGFRDFTDGQSSTLLLGEKHYIPNERDPSVFNGDEFQGYLRACGPALGLAPSADYSAILGRRLFGSAHPQMCNFAIADGSVRSISLTTDRYLLGRLATRGGGEVVSGFDH
jgi:prepilin-type N-terminal cleavage/methylation domain-containing protein